MRLRAYLTCLTLLATEAGAHSGAVLLAAAAPGPSAGGPRRVADGQLADWPGSPGQAVGYKEYGDPAADAGDFTASVQAAWDVKRALLYVAVTVRDDDVVSVSPTSPWNAQDGCELYVDTQHDTVASPARQYAVRGAWDAVTDGAVRAGWGRTADGYACEWRLDLSDLAEDRRRAGTSLGFDISVSDFDRDGSFSWVAWGPGVEKQAATGRRGDLLLPGVEDTPGGVEIILSEAGDGASRMPRTRVQLRALEAPTMWTVLRTDQTGTARADLPAGSYAVRAQGGARADTLRVAPGATVARRIDRALPPPRLHPVRARRQRAGSGAREQDWHSFAQADGMAGGTVTAIHQAADGAVWIGTRSGLSRYDGYWVTTLGRADGLPSTDVRALAGDGDALWIGTGAGLCRLAADSLACFDSGHGLPADDVQALALDGAGRLWAATSLGLASYVDGRFTPLTVDDGLPSHMVSDLAVQGDILWIATWGGLGRWHKGFLSGAQTNPGLPGNTIFDLHAAPDGSLWLATLGGLGQVSQGRLTARYGQRDGLASDNTMAVHADSYGRVWAATGSTVEFQGGSGLCRTSAAGFECFRVEDGLASNQVNVITEDREGLIWVGTSAGVSRIGDGHFEHFTRARGLGADLVQAVVRTRDGEIWAGTEAGLSRLRTDRFETFGVADGLPGAAVWSLLEGRDGRLWIGTDAGLASWKDGRISTYPDGPGRNLILTLEEDQAGRIWIGTWTAGAFVHDGGRFRHYTANDGLGGPEVDAILADRRGRIWMGGWQAGITILEDGGLRTLTTADGLSDPTVISLTEDAQGRIWVGTSRGVNVWNGQEFTTIASGDGLTHDAVRAVAMDAEGRMWLGTDAGVDLWDGRVLQSLLPRDGLRSNEIRDITPDGAGGAWIASTRGLTHYQPRRVQPTVELIDVVTDEHLGTRHRVNTTTDVPAVTFHFQGISFKTRPEGMRYRYRLLGRDSTWTVDRLNRVEYRDLDPGRYEFEVHAVDRDLDDSEPLRVELMVHLPIRSLIGWGAVVLACGLVLVLFVQAVRRNRSLAQANDAAREATEMKSRFLANMSHEIRTPMNGVVGMTELLQQTELTRQQRGYLETINQSAEALLGIINDILDLSKIEAGRLSLERTSFDLAQVAEGVMAMMAPRAHDKELELALRLDPALPRGLIGDPVRLRQVLVNLVGNAVKFTEVGEVVVELTADEISADGILLHGAVRDTGIGIPEEKLAQIFQAFAQADASTTRHYGGTGLGLSICVELTRLMGGRIWAESDAGEGSTFHFTAALGIDPDPEPTPGEAQIRQALQGRSVLVVDDNATNRGILDEVLRNHGLHPHCVDGGPAALTCLRQAAAGGEPYDIALLDAMMPAMDGLVLVQHIRQEAGLSNLPLLMLTSLDDPGYLSQARAAGVVDILRKPVTQADLLEAMARAVAPGAAIDPTSAPVGALGPELPPLRILLAEDNPVNQRVARQLLEGAGHEVDAVGDGQRALDRIRETPDYDAVLMDVQMPTMGGHEATRRIRVHERQTGRHVPIIGLTAHAMAGDREACLEAGMDDYVPKPVRRRVLFEALARVVDVQPEMAPPASPPPPAPEEGVSAAPAAAADQVDQVASEPVLDPGVLEELRELAGDIEDFSVRELVDLFESQGRELLQQIEATRAAGDLEAFTRHAHTLKGSARELGAAQLASLALELETLGKAERMDLAPPGIERVRQAYERAREALREATADDA